MLQALDLAWLACEAICLLLSNKSPHSLAVTSMIWAITRFAITLHSAQIPHCARIYTLVSA